MSKTITVNRAHYHRYKTRKEAMIITTPNKEIVRRIASLYGATFCFMLVVKGSKFIEVHSDINSNKINLCEVELKDWAGMNFKVFNENSEKEKIDKIKKEGVKILPIEAV